MSFNNIVLRGLDKEKFNKNVTANLDIDDFYDGCVTNFKDVLVETIVEMVSEIVEKDKWNLQYFSKEEVERLFIAFMVNTKMTIRLNKSENNDVYYFKKIPLVFNFSEDEKKKIAEIYLNNLFNYPSYFENCIVENPKEINIDLLASLLSIQVNHLLSPEEIKTKFKDKIEKIINNE
jgi:hypothetical protein